jgi:hypothetical protein
MAVTFVTQANANTASTFVTSKTITIPTVSANDVLLLVANCYSNSSGSSTITISSTGSTWSQQGSTQFVSATNAQNNGALFFLNAGASESAKVVTITTSVSLLYNLTMVVYRGTSTTFDGATTTSGATVTTSDTCPTVTTALSGTWLICLGSLCNGAVGFSSCTGPTNASTVREANFGSSSGIAVASDSNGSVATGSHTPGNFTPSSTANFITWSIGLADASATAGSPAPQPVVAPSLAAMQAATW